MSSFLSRLKDAVGLKKPSKGHTLGSNPSSTSAKPGDGPSTDRAAQNVFSGDSEHSTTDSVFSLRFDTEVLGFGVSKDKHGLPVVAAIQDSSLSLRQGDLIIAVDGEDVLSFDAFMEVIEALGRPVTIRFLRRGKKSSLLGSMMSSFSSTSSSKTPSSSMASSGASKSSSLSEAEKAARRDAQMKAAQDRLQSWDKKISTTRKQKIVSESRKSAEESEEMALSEETLRSIDLAKEYERKVALALGYDPFAPIISSSAANAAAASSAAASSAKAAPNPIGKTIPDNKPTSQATGSGSGIPDQLIDVDESIALAVDCALASLVAVAENDSLVAQTAIQTAFKMLSNLANNPNETKFRSIRLSNAAFQSKVAAVDGGLDLMLSAGFELSSEDGDGLSGGSEMFLKHAMTESKHQQLIYCIQRLKDLID